MKRSHLLAVVAWSLLGFANISVAQNAAISGMQDLLFSYKTVTTFWKVGKKLAEGASVASGELRALEKDGLEALNEELKRVEKHRPPPTASRPNVSAVRAFSLDSKTRGSVQAEMAAYLDKSRLSTERLEEKRDQLAATRRKWRDRYDDLYDVEQRLTGVMDDPMVTGFTEYKLVTAWFDLYNDLMPTVGRLADEYAHRVNEYETAIAENKKGQAEISALLDVLKVIHGTVPLPDSASTDTYDGSPVAPRTIDDRIRGSVSAGSLAGRRDIEGARRHVDAIRARNDVAIRQYEERARAPARSDHVPDGGASPSTIDGRMEGPYWEYLPKERKGK